jgi:hypothetical protein
MPFSKLATYINMQLRDCLVAASDGWFTLPRRFPSVSSEIALQLHNYSVQLRAQEMRDAYHPEEALGLRIFLHNFLLDFAKQQPSVMPLPAADNSK